METTDEKKYTSTMAEIEFLLQKATRQGGFQSLTIDETAQLQKLSLAAEAYEDSIPLMPIPAPGSLEEMIRLRMYQLKVNQKQLAQLLEVTETRLSEVLRGKRNINFDMARRLHEKLGIDGNFILEKA